MLRDLAIYAASTALAIATGLWLGSNPFPAQWEPPMGSDLAHDASLAGMSVEFDTGL